MVFIGCGEDATTTGESRIVNRVLVLSFQQQFRLLIYLILASSRRTVRSSLWSMSASILQPCGGAVASEPSRERILKDVKMGCYL